MRQDETAMSDAMDHDPQISALAVGDDRSEPDRGHNQGPELDELPEWQVGDLFVRYCWRQAHRKAWTVSRDIALYRLERAEKLGLTYEEYTLEILERGRNLQKEDVERIEAIKLKRAMGGEV
jgi:hypothetical protein